MPAPLSAVDDAALRRLAQFSIFMAMLGVLTTAGALVRLPNAAQAGQRIVIVAGAGFSIFTFAFGLMISFRRSGARPVGFAVVAATFIAAALFGLLALVVDESRLTFATWTVCLLVYALLTTHRLVRWPLSVASDRPKSAVALFISYRRQDSRDTVGRIHDHLKQRFNEDRIFLDVDRQEAGEDYRVSIRRALDDSDVLLAVIGSRWSTIADRSGRPRLADPDDVVRAELETAFERRLRVIPVLIDGATMPAEDELPLSLRPLSYRTAIPIRPDPDFARDMQQLLLAIEEGCAPGPGQAIMLPGV
jgi:hypothetical protein